MMGLSGRVDPLAGGAEQAEVQAGRRGHRAHFDALRTAMMSYDLATQAGVLDLPMAIALRVRQSTKAAR